MKAVIFYFQNLELNLCLYRFVLAFLPFIVDLTFGKILNIYEKSHSRYINSQLRIQIVQLTCKRFHFCKCPGECPLKNREQNTWNKLVITLICKLKLKAVVICIKIDLLAWRHINLTSCCLSCHKSLGLDQENAHQ